MVLEVQVATTIRRPRPDVAAVMFDQRFAPVWTSGFLRRGSVNATVNAQEPGRFIDMRSGHRSRTIVRFELEGIPEGTIARVKALVATTMLQRVIHPILYRSIRRVIMQDLATLKYLMESGEYRIIELEQND